MEYQASSVALSQKLSSGHSIYDGVFSSAAASKFNVSTFSSRVDDYSEIFGGSVASRGGSSIPVLEVPELHERKASVDVRSSKLDYSNVFGGCGFGDSDFAVPYEELFAEPKKKERRTPAEKRSPSKEADPSSTVENRVLSQEASYQSFDGAKKFNMSYHKTNHRSKSFTGETMLHAVPTYTCLIDEVSPIRTTEGDKPVSSKENGASPDNNLFERMTEGNHLKSAGDLPAGDDRKQTSAGGAEVQNNYDWKRSSSHDELFKACETHPSSSPSISSPLSEGKVEFEKPMASVFGVSRSDNLEGSGHVSSSPYFDEEVDTNSTAAASAAALIKAIEEAQARIKMAKESKERKKTGSQISVKQSFNIGKKFEVKREKFADKVSIPKERKTRELHEEGAVPVHVSTGKKLEVKGDKHADKVSIERKTQELHEEVAVRVLDSTSTKLEVKGNKYADNISIPKERKTRELHEEVAVLVHDSTGMKLEMKGDTYADNVSIPKERKTRELHEEVAVLIHDSTSTKLEVKGDKYADNVSIPKERKTQELHEEVGVPARFSIFSTGPAQVMAAFGDANKLFGAKEAGGKTEENESISTHMGRTQEQADVPEAAEQFYEVSDTDEPDFSEAADQFYEFPDTGEPDLSEPAELFYELSDSSEHQATTVEDEEANPGIIMVQIVDEDEQKRKMTAMEAFEYPELGGERLQAAKYEEYRESEKIVNADGGLSKHEDHASELETVKDAFEQEENENRLEASRELEETWKLQASHVKEILEEKQGELEKQKGDNKRHETQELQETRHVKMKLMPQECVEYQKIGDEAYKQEELEKEQKDVHREEDTERRLNKDSRQDITEDSLNDTNGEQYFENRNESKSEGHEKLGDTTANEMILEGAACEEIECEKRQKESFQCVDDGRMEILIDQSTEDEKVTVAQEDLKKPDCNFEATNNLYEEGENEDLYEKEGPTGHAEYDKDVEETLEGDKYEEIECEKRGKESFQCVEDGRMEIRIDQSTEDERVTVDCEDQKKPDCNFEATNNLCEEGENEDLYEKEGPTGHAEHNKDVEETLEGDKYEEIACEKRQKESFQCVEDGITEIQIDQSTEDEKVTVDCEDLKKPDCNVKATNNLCEEGEIEDPNEKEGPTGHAEYDKDVEETLEVPAHEEDGDRIEVTETLDELKESVNQSESVEEDNVTVEKDMLKTDGLAPDIKLVGIPIIDATEMHSSDTNGTTLRRNDMRCGQKQEDQLAREPEVVCNFGKQVEELGAMNKDMMEGEVAVKQEENRNNSRSSHRKRWFDRLNFSETLNKLKENWNQSESVEEENGKEEKEICEADGLASGVKLAEILKQIEDPIESHPSEENGLNVDINALNCGQNQDVTLETHVEEVEEINEDVKVEVAVNQEENKNNSKSSHRKRWFDDGTSAEVAQLSHMLRRKGGNVLLDHEMETSPCTEESMENDRATTSKESVTTHSSLQELEQEKGENRQTTLTAEESEKHCTSNTVVEQEKMENQQETSTAEESEISERLQKEVEIEKELLKQKQHAKGKERERVKEKKAVERVIREARERAFAEARERAAETRQKAMAEAQERSGKTSVKANDISLAEKASREAKLKSERAAVERATEEAWERALEKSLSGKAYEAGKQAKRSVSEKSSSASRDDGMKPGVSPSDPESKSGYPNSSNHSDPYPAERSGGSNGESAQRCKAKLERNQQTAERASKALAEKNMRDLLVQKEQAERNRLAEGLDAEVKRWSSGKERNLRALLSMLQYILGPDSGWQPIPLTEIVTTVAVKKAYRKAALFVHPDKLQQRGASIQQKYTCEKVFDLLKEAWNRFNVEER